MNDVPELLSGYDASWIPREPDLTVAVTGSKPEPEYTASGERARSRSHMPVGRRPKLCACGLTARQRVGMKDHRCVNADVH